MIAGFVSIERGSIYFDDKIINKVPPQGSQDRHGFPRLCAFPPHLTVEKKYRLRAENQKTYQADEIAGGG